MRKLKLILWGNCQAGFLAEALRASPGLLAAFEVKDYQNFTRPGIFDYESCPLEELESCDVLVYHKVYTPQFIESANARLKHLPLRALRIPIPYLKSNLYWPFFNTIATPMLITPETPWGKLPYRSFILDSWIGKGHTDDSIIEAFTALDPAEHLDMQLLEKETYERWRSLEADSEGKLRFASFLMQNWRANMQFYIYNHVAKPILLHLANQILEHLNLPALSMKDIAKCRCGQRTTYPVHPGAARFYGITFAKEGSRYGLDEKNYTFREFLRFYLATARADAPPGTDTAFQG